MSKRPHSDNLRRAVAQEAARVMAEHGIHDFLAAKRKAAERLGVTENAALPKNTEIEAALAEYQRLFEGETHGESLIERTRSSCPPVIGYEEPNDPGCAKTNRQVMAAIQADPQLERVAVTAG